MTEEIQLTGDAVYGLPPTTLSAEGQRNFRSLVAQLPITVKLGRRPPRPGQQALQFSKFFSPSQMRTAPPPSINRRDKAAASLARMYMNDRLGCCVISGKGHMFGVMAANDSDSGGEVQMTDAEVQQQYQSFCGPGDRGCNIQDVLNRIKSGGFVMNGRRYNIDGYVQADWRNRTQVQVAQYLFGATCIGFMLPALWTNTAVWDVTNSKIVGGHDVTPIDYDSSGVYVSSWGRIYRMTWPAFMSTRYIQEYFVILAGLWYGQNQMAPSGFNVTKLREALSMIGSGGTPDVTPAPSPVPDPTPVPVPVPGGGYTRTLTITSASPITVTTR